MSELIPRPVASAIVVLVTIVWSANFVAQFVVEGYSPDVAINGIFMGVVGAALAFSRKGPEAPPPAPSVEPVPEVEPVPPVPPPPVTYAPPASYAPHAPPVTPQYEPPSGGRHARRDGAT